jgi:hypothetical protein
MDWLKALSPFAAVFQTVLWVLLALGAFWWARPLLRKVAEALTRRIEGGSSFKAGPIEVGPELRQLEHVSPADEKAPDVKTPVEIPPPIAPPALPSAEASTKLLASPLPTPEWASERQQMYQDCRGVFLVHVISPSEEPGQRFDIFVFLVRHKSDDFTDIEYAEFFFGHYWGNRVFRKDNNGGTIGVSTSAYGPVLCTCRVHFRDGGAALITRYVDFEMAKVLPSLEEPANKAFQRTARARRR